MTKKDKMLKGGLDTLLGNSINSEARQDDKVANEEGDANTTKEYGRMCAIVNNQKMNKLRQIASNEGLSIKAVLEAAMELAIEKYEAKHGEIVFAHKADKSESAINVFK